jgi:peptidoglycan-N-acetylglucosamine deacetylase
VSLRLAITIDTEHPDRPADPANPERLFATLERLDVHATVFLEGRLAAARPGFARSIAEGGHLIGNHSMWHTPMVLLDDDGVKRTVNSAAEAIEAATGADPKPWFRCPYGEGQDDPRVLGLLQQLGYQEIRWEVDSHDWSPGRDPDAMTERVVAEALARGDGARLLFHSWPDPTAEALEAIVSRLRAQGAELVRIDAL